MFVESAPQRVGEVELFVAMRQGRRLEQPYRLDLVLKQCEVDEGGRLAGGAAGGWGLPLLLHRSPGALEERHLEGGPAQASFVSFGPGVDGRRGFENRLRKSA